MLFLAAQVGFGLRVAVHRVLYVLETTVKYCTALCSAAQYASSIAPGPDSPPLGRQSADTKLARIHLDAEPS
jgi:hypothetical protein